MLNKYRYQNKISYKLRTKKNQMLLWENKSKFIYKTQHNKKSNIDGNIYWKHSDMNNIIYKSATKYYQELTSKFWKEKKGYNEWEYYTVYKYRKRPFIGHIKNRKNFIDNILSCIKNKDSMNYIRNSLYYLFEDKLRLTKIFDVLNFSWLYMSKDNSINYEEIESYNLAALKSFYYGFLKKSNKRKCEIKFMELLSMLKLKLGKSSLHIMYFFIMHLKPLVGFRRRRLGHSRTKKKEIRYSFKLYGHNLRWQRLLFKRICFNSPYYQKRTQLVSVSDLYKSLLLSMSSRGPIAKCLGMYYALIGKRTPYAKRQKKKKRKSKFIRS